MDDEVERLILEHADIPVKRIYNPAKAHEYYMKNRKLKGRQKAKFVIGPKLSTKLPPKTLVKQPTKAQQPVKALPLAPKALPKTSLASAKKPLAKVKSAAERQRELKVKVDELKGRLDVLKETLAGLVKEAKAKTEANAGTTSATKDQAGGSKGASGGDSTKLTSAQKADAAKSSKEYYDKNVKDKGGTSSLADQQKNLTESIARITEKITKVRSELKGSVSSAKTQAMSKPGAKPTPGSLAQKPKPGASAQKPKPVRKTVSIDNYDLKGYDYKKGKWYDPKGKYVGDAQYEDSPIKLVPGVRLKPKRKPRRRKTR